MFKKGQQIVVKLARVGDRSQTIAISATVLKQVGKKKLLCQDRSGKKFKIDPDGPHDDVSP